MSTLQGNWGIKRLKDVHKTQPFRKVLGPSGVLEEDLWVKEEFDEKRDKYLCKLHEPASPFEETVSAFYSPRFAVYVEEEYQDGTHY
tara:strand:- start:418 stop:678 length:261 start_codon:yes stop_codon:yes gene_type:complete